MIEKRIRKAQAKIPFPLDEATESLYTLFAMRKHDKFKLIKTSIKQTYTEPLAMNILPLIIPETYTYMPGGNVADLFAIKDDIKLNVEIKSSIEAGFTCLGKKDIVADILVWIDFNTFFSNRDVTEINVYVARDVTPFFIDLNPKTLRCTKIEKFLEILGENAIKTTFNLKEFIFGK